MVIGPDQLDVGGVSLVQQDEDVIGRDDRASPRLTLDGWIDALIVKRDACVGDRVAVQQQPGRRRVHGDAPQTEGLEDLVDATLLPEHLHLEYVKRGRLRRPEIGVRQGERGVHRNRRVMAKLATVNALRRERQRTRRDQAGRIGIGQVSWIDCGGQNVDTNLHRRRVAATLMKRDRDIGSIQVRHDVGADGVNGGRRLHPDWLRKSAVVPPVRQPPWHDVLTCPPWRIVDPDGNDVDVIRDNGVGHIKGEWG